MTLDVKQALGHRAPGLRAELRRRAQAPSSGPRGSGGRSRRTRPSAWSCEIAFTILEGHLDGDTYRDKAHKPTRFKEARKKLENATVRPVTRRLPSGPRGISDADCSLHSGLMTLFNPVLPREY